MANLSKNGSSSFGSDWDLDLGWILFWVVLGLTISSVVWAVCFAAIKTNDRNNQKQEQFFKSCKQVDIVYLGNNKQTSYECR